MESQSPPNMYDVEDRVVPQIRSLEEMGIDNKEEIPLELVNPSSPNVFQMDSVDPMIFEEETPGLEESSYWERTSKEDRKVIEKEGGIFLTKPDFYLTLETPLGASDKYDKFSATAIPQDAIFTSDGVKFKLTYEVEGGSYFDEVTFLHLSNGDLPVAGQVDPSMFFAPAESYGLEGFSMTNYADSPKGIVINVPSCPGGEAGTCVFMPIVVVGNPSRITPPRVEKGVIIQGEYDQIDIMPSATTGANKAYWGWARFQLTKEEEKDYFDLEFQGILTGRGKGPKFYAELADLPREVSTLLEKS